MIVDVAPPTAKDCEGIEPFVVTPPEHEGLDPDVTSAGCVTVLPQSIYPSETFEKPAGIEIRIVNVLGVAVVSVANLLFAKSESDEVIEDITPKDKEGVEI